jgi:hypothetical protein
MIFIFVCYEEHFFLQFRVCGNIYRR